MRINNIILAAYIAVVIITFGHAYNNISEPEGRKHPTSVKTYFAIIVAPAWPLYWSVVLWQK